MPPNNPVSLKEFMETRFDALDERVEMRFNATDKKVDALEKRQGSLELKVEDLTQVISNDILHTLRVWKWIGGLIVSIIVVVTTAWILQRLGL